MKYLHWLIGTSAVSFILALASNEALKALHNHAEAELLTREVRGGIFGAVAGITLGILGTPAAKRSVSGWRGKLPFANKEKKR